jgi:DNA topoisomerase-3
MGMLSASGMQHLAPFAQQAMDNGYVKPTKRVFDNSKVSDHFAIIPTLQAPSGLSDAEQRLYDLVVRRFLSVFFPSAEYLVTTRISRVGATTSAPRARCWSSRAGWRSGARRPTPATPRTRAARPWSPCSPASSRCASSVEAKGLKTRPPARYSEATLLGAMEGAGKNMEDEELREAMQEKGLGTPATRAAIIEGLIGEKYMLRDGRELIPTAKAFQLMTLLRGLGVEELSKPELTGEWEYKLAQMEHGKLSRDAFMHEIAEMTERIVKKAKEYDRDTVPGDYATLSTPCPNCSGVVRENYRRYTCTGAAARDRRLRLLVHQDPGRARLRAARGRAVPARQAHRPAGGLPLQGGLAVHRRDRAEVQRGRQELEAGVRLRRRGRPAETGELIDFSAQEPLGPCPKCGARVFEFGKNYVCEKSVPTPTSPRPPATSRPARSSCSSRWSASRCTSCWPPARPTCWTSSCRCARAARSRPSWPGMPKPAR